VLLTAAVSTDAGPQGTSQQLSRQAQSTLELAIESGVRARNAKERAAGHGFRRFMPLQRAHTVIRFFMAVRDKNGSSR
jgi:hypothetical protein